MASTSKVIYETRPWSLGATGVTIGAGTTFALDTTTIPTSTKPTASLGTGISALIDIGYARSISIMFTGEAEDESYEAAVFGWARTNEDTPIYIPTLLAHCYPVTIGCAEGVAGSSVLPDDVFLAQKFVIDTSFIRSSPLGGVPVLAYNAPETISASQNGADNNTSILRIELGWGIEAINVKFYRYGFDSSATGFIYSLA